MVSLISNRRFFIHQYVQHRQTKLAIALHIRCPGMDASRLIQASQITVPARFQRLR